MACDAHGVDKGKESPKGLSYPRGKRGEGIGRQEK